MREPISAFGMAESPILQSTDHVIELNINKNIQLIEIQIVLIHIYVLILNISVNDCLIL